MSRIGVFDIPANVVPFVFVPGGTGPVELPTREAVRASLDDAGTSNEASGLPVRRFSLTDSMNDLGGLFVEVLVTESLASQFQAAPAPRRPDPLSGLLGTTAMFAWACGTDQDRTFRYFHGCIHSVVDAGGDNNAMVYELALAPRFWRTTLQKRCRIFQPGGAKPNTTPGIIETVLAEYGLEAGVDAVFDDLTEQYQERPFVVQYNESDYDFLCRLMEEQGIVFCFEHTEERDVIRFSDTTSSLQPCAPYDAAVVSLSDEAVSAGDHAREERISSFRFSHGLRTSRTRLRDYDFERSQSMPEATSSGLAPEDAEDYRYPGGFVEPGQGRRLARVSQEQIDVSSQVVHGAGDVRSLAAGCTFEVIDHPRPSCRGVYLCTSVTHSGESGALVRDDSAPVGEGQTHYVNGFECLPEDVPFRPSRTRAKPYIRGVQTARVVGPENEEIHTDEFLRVKVRFHWDTRTEDEEDASCWIRCAQVWADAGFGAVVIPRVGTEVLVEFEDGDPDRPLICGALYNDKHRPPQALPANKNHTVIRSNSTPGGGGYNEILFDDTKNAERFEQHAQKDMTTTVGNNQTTTVGNNQDESIGNDRTDAVGSNETLSVGANRDRTVGGNESVSVSGSCTRNIGASSTTNVAAVRTESIGGASFENVGGAKTLSIGAAYAVTVGGAMNTAVALAQFEEVGKTKKVIVGDEIEFSCGDSKLVMKKDGTITIKGKDIKIEGSGAINIKASKDVVMKGKNILQN